MCGIFGFAGKRSRAGAVDLRAAIRSLHLDMLIMGVHGVTADVGLTTPNLLEAETDRALVAASARLVVVADHTKWGVRGLSRIAGLEKIDVFVSDHGLDRALDRTLIERDAFVLVTPAPNYLEIANRWVQALLDAYTERKEIADALETAAADIDELVGA